jgi:hypothetical protein
MGGSLLVTINTQHEAAPLGEAPINL